MIQVFILEELSLEQGGLRLSWSIASNRYAFRGAKGVGKKTPENGEQGGLRLSWSIASNRYAFRGAKGVGKKTPENRPHIPKK